MMFESRRELAGFHADRLSDRSGWGSTIPVAFGRLLHEAELCFGQRDQSWTPVGVMFGGRVSGVWYPDPPEAKLVAVRLSENLADAGQSPWALECFLRHEVVHLLSPSGGKSCLAVEEGVAVLFGEQHYIHAGLPPLRQASGAYVRARALAIELLTANPNAITEIRRMERDFSEFTPSLIQQVCPAIDLNVAADLCEPFSHLEARLGGPARD